MAKGLLSKLKGTFGKGGPPPTEPSAPKSAPSPAPKAATPKTDTPKANTVWPANRLNVVERLWGDGYVTPGGAEEVKKLLPLLALDSKKSVLVLGSGLGGIHETIVEDTGAWITGIERDRELAEIGHESMVRRNLKKQAPIRYNDLEKLELKPKSFDAALSIEGTLAVADKKALFQAVSDGLRVHGEFWFTELALPTTQPPNDRVKIWLGLEPKANMPHPWPVEALVAALGAANMEIRPVEDITQDYRKWVMGGFMRFLSSLNKAELLSKAQDVMSEAERWTARVAALDSGGLKAVRLHAIKMPEKRKSVTELMAKR